ncbi:arabinose transporter [Chitinasiproducens palmae]|uniref:Uncharacterized MFS-type transporter SAMN05216551_105206 n=1 Tax=Chitinasiproducens palmae TaxID=1770053 RepID=A0A1H2PPB3_9BURK|nr:arabinose transporter [Chitinasiproducens palmae]SDV48580.1 Predicted arabinose efflux permease, MFS family [Chitinasiproducens palmae]
MTDSTPAASRGTPHHDGTGKLAALCAAVALGYLTICLPLPVIPLFVHEVLGYGDVMVGVAVGIQFLATVLTRGVTGKIADQRGPKVAMVAGLSMTGVSGLIYGAVALLPLPNALRFALLIVGRLAMGCGESLTVTGMLAWAIGSLGAHQASRVMSWTGAALYGALAVGAPLGLWIGQSLGFVAVAACIVASAVCGLALAAALRGVAAPGGKRIGLGSVLGRIAPAGFALCLQGVGFAAIGAFVSLYFHARGWSGAGLTLSAFGAAFVAVRLLFGRLPDRFGGAQVATVSMLVEAVGQAMLWLAPSFAWAVAGAAITGLGCSLVFPALGTLVVSRVPPQNRGTALGAYAAFQDISYGLTGPITGFAAARAGYPIVFAIGLAASLCGAVLAWALARRTVRAARPDA